MTDRQRIKVEAKAYIDKVIEENQRQGMKPVEI